MFKFVEEIKFTRKVEVQVPNDQGSVTRQQFNAHFTAVSEDSMEATLEGVTENSDKAALRLVWTGWDGIQKDKSNEEIPFSEDFRETLLSAQYIRLPVARAYFEAMSGLSEKN